MTPGHLAGRLHPPTGGVTSQKDLCLRAFFFLMLETKKAQKSGEQEKNGQSMGKPGERNRQQKRRIGFFALFFSYFLDFLDFSILWLADAMAKIKSSQRGCSSKGAKGIPTKGIGKTHRKSRFSGYFQGVSGCVQGAFPYALSGYALSG